MVELYEKRELGPGYVQLAVHHASQPPELVIQVLERRLSGYAADSPLKQQLQTYLKHEAWSHSACNEGGNVERG